MKKAFSGVDTRCTTRTWRQRDRETLSIKARGRPTCSESVIKTS